MRDRITSSKKSVSSYYSSWDIGVLLKKSFIRTKNRFVYYLLANVLGLIAGSGVFFGALTIGSLLSLFTSTIGSTFLAVAIISFFILLVALIFIYVFSWTQLLSVELLIQSRRQSLIRTFNKINPMILDYQWFLILSSLFIAGLIPLSIVSVSIISILWFFWNNFSIFVYLKRKKRGLDNLWYSRSLINQKFWTVLTRFLFVNIIAFGLYFLLLTSGDYYAQMSIPVFSFLLTPFLISFNYEIYKLLKEPKEVVRPKIWIWLSVAGWVINLIVLTAFVIVVRQSLFLLILKKPSLPKISPTSIPTKPPVRNI